MLIANTLYDALNTVSNNAGIITATPEKSEKPFETFVFNQSMITSEGIVGVSLIQDCIL